MGGVEIEHRRDGDPCVLAEEVTLADGPFARARGLIGRAPLKPGEALVIRCGEVRPRRVHTFFVRAAVDVLWVGRERVTRASGLRPWRIGPSAPADTIVELPAGRGADVRPGEIVRLRPDPY